MGKELTNKARFAWASATAHWPPEKKKKVKDPGALYDKWAKIQIAMEKKIAELAALDAQMSAQLVVVKKHLDGAANLVGKDDAPSWQIMRKLLTELNRHFCEANKKRVETLHFANTPAKLD